MDKQELSLARELAATENYDHVEKVGAWRGMAVFFACKKELLGACYGYPTYILVSTTGKARFAKFPSEVESIMRSLPE